MDGEQLREWLHPQPGTGLLTRLLYLLEYVSVVFFFNVFSMPQKSGFRRSFMFAGQMMDHGFSLLVFPEGQRAIIEVGTDSCDVRQVRPHLWPPRFGPINLLNDS